jgi:protein involved in polysaccharide export with SLBB domain
MKSFCRISGLILLLAVFLTACTTQHYNLPRAATLPSAEKPAPYIIQPGDQLDVKFFYNPEFNESVTVRPDGNISLQLVDDILAAGKTPAALDDSITEKYAQELRKPVVTVIVRSFSAQRVYVGGEVARPGFVNLTAGMTPLQAVVEAGGFRETADPEAVILIRKGLERQPVPVRVDLKSALTGSEPLVELHALDVVYVPKTLIAEANKFVQQYVQDLLLFRGVSLGFSYELYTQPTRVEQAQ